MSIICVIPSKIEKQLINWVSFLLEFIKHTIFIKDSVLNKFKQKLAPTFPGIDSCL